MLKATLVGNLGQDPEMRYSAEGRPVLTFRVASNYRTRTPEGEWQDRTEWVRVRVVGQRAESLAQYLRKGSRVFVDGRLEARPWLNNQQQPQSGLEIFASDVEFMSQRQVDGQPVPASVADERSSRHAMAVGTGRDDGRQSGPEHADEDDLGSLPF